MLNELGYIFLVAGIVLLAFSLLDLTTERETDASWVEREDRKRSDFWRD
jgi:hypothetical protein